MIFTFLGFTVGWLTQMIAGALAFVSLLTLVRAVVEHLRNAPPWTWALRGFTEPFVRPFRRLLAPLHWRRDPAAWLAALTYYSLQLALNFAGNTAVDVLLQNHTGVPTPTGKRVVDLAAALVWSYTFVVLLRVVVSTLGGSERHPFVRALARVVDPPLELLRRGLPRRVGGLDWSPFLLLAGLWFVNQVVLNTLLYAR